MKNFYLVLFVGIVIFSLVKTNSSIIHAQSSSLVKTEGTVGFYGKYESETEPNPNPPNGVDVTTPEKISVESNLKTFPKLNQILQKKWLGGIVLILFIIIIKIKTKEKFIKKNMKRGAYL